jgi:hypothetical protein
MDNVQLQKSFVSKPSSLTFKSYLLNLFDAFQFRPKSDNDNGHARFYAHLERNSPNIIGARSVSGESCGENGTHFMNNQTKGIKRARIVLRCVNFLNRRILDSRSGDHEDITPRSPLKINRRFGGTRRLHLHRRRITQPPA